MTFWPHQSPVKSTEETHIDLKGSWVKVFIEQAACNAQSLIHTFLDLLAHEL